MSGRAGRRGLDEKGNVIIYINDAKGLPETIDMKNIVDTKGE
jgi:antiviral helicase SKI2